MCAFTPTLLSGSVFGMWTPERTRLISAYDARLRGRLLRDQGVRALWRDEIGECRFTTDYARGCDFL